MDDPCDECLIKVRCDEVCEEKNYWIRWTMNLFLRERWRIKSG